METALVYHNPRCSKSRATLQLLEQQGVPFKVVRYLEQPLDREGLQHLLGLLQRTPSQIVRRNEAAADGLPDDEEAILEAILQHPVLMERPVVVYRGRAVVARPPEQVLALLH